MRWLEMGSGNRSRTGTRSTPEGKGNAERKVQENPSHSGKSCELWFSSPACVLFYQNVLLFMHLVRPKSLKNVMNQEGNSAGQPNVAKYQSKPTQAHNKNYLNKQ